MRAREIKRKWLAALEGGEYKQASDQLYNPDTKGFCCLGVLQHLLLDGKVETCKFSIDEPKSFSSFNDPECFDIGVPSKDFYSAFPQLSWVERNQRTLVEMNDRETDFKEVAAFIRKEWKV